MNFVRAASLRVGNVVYIPNHNGQWIEATGVVTKIELGNITGMLTIYLEDGANFRAFPNSNVPCNEDHDLLGGMICS